MVACNSHQTTPRSRARDRLSQYFIGLCLKFEIYRASPPTKRKIAQIVRRDVAASCQRAAMETNPNSRR